MKLPHTLSASGPSNCKLFNETTRGWFGPALPAPPSAPIINNNYNLKRTDKMLLDSCKCNTESETMFQRCGPRRGLQTLQRISVPEEEPGAEPGLRAGSTSVLVRTLPAGGRVRGPSRRDAVDIQRITPRDIAASQKPRFSAEPAPGTSTRGGAVRVCACACGGSQRT